MGYLFAGHCHDTTQQAADAFFTETGPQFSNSGSTGATNRVLYYTKNGGTTWQQCNRDMTNTAPTCVTATVPTFPSCDATEGFVDGVIIGWGIVAAMAGAFAFKLIQKAIT